METDIKKQIETMEAQMALPEFWNDKERAQTVLREHASLKTKLAEKDKYEKGNAIMTVFSGAGGDDAEDFSAMLLSMYMKYASGKNWGVAFIHENKNDHGGYRNVTVEIAGKGAYGILKNESGVHRLVRVSPFNADKKRHTSFSLVEVIPKFEKPGAIEIKPDEIRVEFARSSGPGGQNVNKRETAVRVIHLPTKISVHADGERSQAQNRERAMKILEAKLYKMREEERLAKEKGMQISNTTDIEWGNQIRSYVLHPYKMVKDHRTNVETAKIDDVFDGSIDLFLEAENQL